MKIKVVSQDGSVISNSLEIVGPMKNFFSRLNELGHYVCTPMEVPEAIISMNIHPRMLRKLRKFTRKSKRILILWEPRVVRPVNFRPIYLNDFGLVVSPSRYWLGDTGRNLRLFNWPQSKVFKITNSKKWSDRRDEIAIFQANKISVIPGELYSLRREFIARNQDCVAVYGEGWNNTKKSLIRASLAIARAITGISLPRFSGLNHLFVHVDNYHGYAQDKDSTLSNYKFTLVIENSGDYVSEKIIEAIRVGSIPIYVGPALSDFDVPAGVVAACEFDVNSIERCYSNLKQNEKRQEEIRKAGQEFLNSKSFNSHINHIVFEELADIVHEQLGLGEV
jgi:hypothetical protein